MLNGSELLLVSLSISVYTKVSSKSITLR